MVGTIPYIFTYIGYRSLVVSARRCTVYEHQFLGWVPFSLGQPSTVGDYFSDKLPPLFLKLPLNYGYILQITLNFCTFLSLVIKG